MMPRLRDETPARRPDLWKGALAGLAAGIVAAAAMNAFQSAVQTLSPADEDDDAESEPATVKAADRLSVAATGARVPDESRDVAGQVVHYALGAALGLGYGIAAEYRPEATAGFGTAFGGAVAAILDEAAVPAAGLAPAPTETPPTTHLYGFASHFVFGGVAEGVRRIVRLALR